MSNSCSGVIIRFLASVVMSEYFLLYMALKFPELTFSCAVLLKFSSFIFVLLLFRLAL
ncbi:hypothetical protein [Escherichia phage IMM-001]|nr:hypothetical protein [Escherichia phage IMM-001]